MTELQDIRDGLYYTLYTWGPFTASEMSTCAFDVLEFASGCAIVFLPGDSDFEALGFGASGNDYRHWGIEGSGYIKDTGDPKSLLRRVWKFHDDLYDTVRLDHTLNGAASFARVTRMSFARDVGVEAGGHYWAEVKFTVIADVLD